DRHGGGGGHGVLGDQAGHHDQLHGHQQHEDPAGGQQRAFDAGGAGAAHVGGVLSRAIRVEPSTWMPRPMSSIAVSSSGTCERPPIEGTKIMPIGAMWARWAASWPAPEGTASQLMPSRSAA